MGGSTSGVPRTQARVVRFVSDGRTGGARPFGGRVLAEDPQLAAEILPLQIRIPQRVLLVQDRRADATSVSHFSRNRRACGSPDIFP